MRRLPIIVFIAAALALPAEAQCVMCFRTAAAQNQARARVLNAGVLVLGVPALAIFTGFVLLLRRRSAEEEEED